MTYRTGQAGGVPLCQSEGQATDLAEVGGMLPAMHLEVVSGEEARASGLPDASLPMDYIRIQLPRPVAKEGGVRLLIEKTYKDPESRPIPIRRAIDWRGMCS